MLVKSTGRERVPSRKGAHDGESSVSAHDTGAQNIPVPSWSIEIDLELQILRTQGFGRELGRGGWDTFYCIYLKSNNIIS